MDNHVHKIVFTMREVKLVASFNFKGTVSHKQYVTSFKMYNKCFYNIDFYFFKDFVLALW